MVYDVNELDLSPFSNLILDVCFAQGLPSTFHVVLVSVQLLLFIN